MYHYYYSEFDEPIPLHWIGGLLSNHIISTSPFQAYSNFFYSIINEKITIINVFSMITNSFSSICFQEYCDIFVLVQDRGFHFINLCLQKIIRSYGMWTNVTYSYQFGFSKTLVFILRKSELLNIEPFPRDKEPLLCIVQYQCTA